MSGWRILFAVSAVVLVIFGAMLVMLWITGDGGGNGVAATPTASLTPMPTPVIWTLPAYFAATSPILSESTVVVLSSPIETP